MVMAVVMSRHFGLLTSEFIARETTIDVRRTEARVLEFPAVTICNANPIKKSALESLAGGNPLLQQLLDLDESGASNRRRRKSEFFHWACSITTAEDLLRRSEGKQKMYKSSGQKQKYILPLTLALVSLKSMCFHTATYRSFPSFCDRDGRQRSIPSGPFCHIEWREYNLLFLEGLPCGKRIRPLF